MANDQNSNETLPRLLNIPLKDWAIIIAALGSLITYWVNSAGENATNHAQTQIMVKEIADVKTILKEIQIEHKTSFKDLEKKYIDQAVQITILQTKVSELEKRR